MRIPRDFSCSCSDCKHCNISTKLSKFYCAKDNLRENDDISSSGINQVYTFLVDKSSQSIYSFNYNQNLITLNRL